MPDSSLINTELMEEARARLLDEIESTAIGTLAERATITKSFQSSYKNVQAYHDRAMDPDEIRTLISSRPEIERRPTRRQLTGAVRAGRFYSLERAVRSFDTDPDWEFVRIIDRQAAREVELSLNYRWWHLRCRHCQRETLMSTLGLWRKNHCPCQPRRRPSRTRPGSAYSTNAPSYNVT